MTFGASRGAGIQTGVRSWSTMIVRMFGCVDRRGETGAELPTRCPGCARPR